MPYKEAVVFLFYKDGKILVEERPVKFLNNAMAVLIPGGVVEKNDGTGMQGLENALMREVGEEFAGKIKIEKYEYLGPHSSGDIKLNFHCFLITKWGGDMPDHTVENGKKFSRLFWIRLADHKKYNKFRSSIYFCERLIERLNK